MIDTNYILNRKRKIKNYIGINMDKIPAAIVDELNEFHNEITSLIFLLEKEKNNLRARVEYLKRSRKQITEMFIEENAENAERNIKQVKWYVNERLPNKA